MRLENIGEELKKIQDGGRIAIIADATVAALYLGRCSDSLAKSGFDIHTMVVQPGEASKSGETYLAVLEFLASIPLTRTDGVVALGGGMVGDLAGFAAATYLRGVKVIQVPTTLLAAVDSSVGGKTAINLRSGKNLAGAFHQPALVVQDAELFESLPESVFRDGMAEVIKYGVIADEKLFTRLWDKEALRDDIEEIVERCVAIKKSYVEADEFDTGVRHMLNFGHTIAHAVEKLSGYKISHGSAVAMGMDMISQISVRQGWCDQMCAGDIRRMILNYGFDLKIPFSKEDIFEIMKTDKKRKADHIDIIVPERIGKCIIKRLTIEELGNIL